jgi:hypothetical protein
MAYTRTWNASYEASPDDDLDDIGDGGQDVRQLKADIRERLAHDHYMDITGTDADHGEHQKITFHAPETSPGSPGANKAFLYTKDISGKAELHFKDEDDNEIQISSVGVPATAFNAIPSGEIILFEKDTAVAGYTLQTDVDDMLAFISKGSGAGGETGAGDHSTGTWQLPDHILVVDEMPSHKHFVVDASNRDAGLSASNSVSGFYNPQNSDNFKPNLAGVEAAAPDVGLSSATGGGEAHNHGSDWRPACRVFTRQERD